MDRVYEHQAAYLRARLEKTSRTFPTLPHSCILPGIADTGRNVLKFNMWLEEHKSQGLGLRRRIQALPQELQDIIFDFCIFSHTAGGIVHIFDDTKPPSGLQIDRSTRARFASFYYGSNNIFQFTQCGDCVWPSAWRCGRWLERLPVEHAQMIQTLRIQHGDKIPTSRYRVITNRAHRKFQDVAAIVRQRFCGLRDGVVYTDQLYWPPIGVGVDQTLWYNVTYDLNGSVRVERL